jgi:hypothetical protein
VQTAHPLRTPVSRRLVNVGTELAPFAAYTVYDHDPDHFERRRAIARIVPSGALLRPSGGPRGVTRSVGAGGRRVADDDEARDEVALGTSLVAALVRRCGCDGVVVPAATLC